MENIIDHEQELLLEPSLAERFSMITQYINLYYTPILCIFGGFGNCVSLYIFCSTSARNLSSSYYLSALAISDTGFLINLLALWLTTDLGFNVITTKLSCPLVMFLGQVTCFLSVWFVVAFTVERFFAVCYPLTRPTVCTVARARKVIFGITITALILFSYVWVIAQVVEIRLPFNINEDEANYDLNYNSSSTLTPSAAENEDTELLLNDWPYLHLMDTSSSSSGSLEPFGNYYDEESQVWNKSEDTPESIFLLQSAAQLQHQQQGPTIDSPSSSSTEIWNSTQNSSSIPPISSTSTSTIHLICTVPRKYYKLSRIANYLDSFFTLILPFCIITFLNIRITICVWKLKGQRETIVAIKKLAVSNRQNNAPSPNNALRISPSTPIQPTAQQNNHHRIVRRVPFTCSFLKQHKHTVRLHTFNHVGVGGSNNTSNETSPNEASILTDPLIQDNSGTTNNLSAPAPTRTLDNNTLSYSDPAGLNRLSSTKQQKPGPIVSHGTVTKKMNGHGPQHHQHSTAAEVRVTKTLLLVSTVFLVLNLPSHGMRAAAFIQQTFWPDSPPAEPSALHQWAYILFNTNFGVNFLLYCVSGRNFRKALYNLLCCTNRRNRKRRSAGAGGSTTGIGMMLRNQSGKRRNNSYIRNSTGRQSSRYNNNNKRNNGGSSVKRRVIKTCTQCPCPPSLHGGNNDSINLQRGGRRQKCEHNRHHQEEEDDSRNLPRRHPSIQSTSFMYEPATVFSTSEL